MGVQYSGGVHPEQIFRAADSGDVYFVSVPRYHKVHHRIYSGEKGRVAAEYSQRVEMVF